MNNVKRILEKGGASFGGWCLSGSPAIAEAMAPYFDWIAIDMEHGSMSVGDVENCIRAIQHGGAEPFVRVDRMNSIGKCLDIGATGIIIPNIDDHLEAINEVRECKYPPRGYRSFSLARCTDYGLGAAEHFKDANGEIFIVLMIESKEAVEDVASIAGVSGVDAIMIGPYDLSGSCGSPGDFGAKNYREAIMQIRSACLSAGIPYGIHDPYATAEDLRGYVADEDMKFIGAGMDTTTLAEQCSSMMTEARNPERNKGDE